MFMFSIGRMFWPPLLTHTHTKPWQQSCRAADLLRWNLSITIYWIQI